MKKILTFLTTILLMFSATADDHMTPPTMFPIEGIQCKYNEGMGLADLQNTVAKWNKYMDQSVAEGNPEYSAYLLSPYMIPGSEFDLDFVWFGMWSSFNDLEGIPRYLSEAKDIEEEFNAVATCHTRQLAPSLIVRPIEASEAKGEGNIVQIRSCKNIGTPQETLAAFNQFSSRLDELEADMAILLMVKGPGTSSSADYDFLQMNVSTAATFGSLYDEFWNKGSMQGLSLADAVDCGPTRIYIGTALRENS